MVSAQDDKLSFYFKPSVGSVAKEHYTSSVWPYLIFLILFKSMGVFLFMMLWNIQALADFAAEKRCELRFDNWKVTT